MLVSMQPSTIISASLEWGAILTKDSTDDFVENDLDLHTVQFYDEDDEVAAYADYMSIKGKLSNVYLVKILESEVNIWHFMSC